jgi:hypothetical protein
MEMEWNMALLTHFKENDDIFLGQALPPLYPNSFQDCGGAHVQE